jgi:hypothetical protein
MTYVASWSRERWARGSFVFVLVTACSRGPIIPDGGALGRDADRDAPDGSVIEAAAESDAPDATTDLGETGADGGHCGFTRLGATIALHRPDGSVLACQGKTDAGTTPESAPPETWVGKVTGSDASSLVVSICSHGATDGDAGAADGGGIDARVSDAGCVPSAIRIEAHSPGLDLTRFPRVWVRVRVRVTFFWYCQQSLEVTTADPSDGSTPQGPAGQLLLAVVDGGWAFGGSPYEVDRVQLGCAPGPTCNGGKTDADDYAFDFKSPSGTGSPTRVYMGETVPWRNDGADFTVSNLRSFQTGYCDDYWNWAYTIYVDPK